MSAKSYYPYFKKHSSLICNSRDDCIGLDFKRCRSQDVILGLKMLLLAMNTETRPLVTCEALQFGKNNVEVQTTGILQVVLEVF